MNRLTQFIDCCKAVYLNGTNKQDYATSFSNPDCCPKPNADLLAIIYDIFCKRALQIKNGLCMDKLDSSALLDGLSDYCKQQDREILQHALDRDYLSNACTVAEYETQQICCPANTFSELLNNANPDLTYLNDYGVRISETERYMADFWFSRPKALIDKLANHIVQAFLHGFLSQSRDRKGRQHVRMVYAISQEPLAKAVVDIFKTHGIQVILLTPSSLGDPQHTIDHQNDQAVYSPSCYDVAYDAYQKAFNAHTAEINKTCGFIRIGTFGTKLGDVKPGEQVFVAPKEHLSALREMRGRLRNLEAGVLKPDTLSFCSVVFPDIGVGKELFEELFDDFCSINTADSYPVEEIQAQLIDMLDGCAKVKLLGRNGNLTDLTVALSPLENKKTQTLFLNCGGDLNIPHGEFFTTPKLSGTHGTLHAKEIFLKGDYYSNLKLTFEDGIVTQYYCDNFGDEQKNQDYVFQKLLNGTEQVTMGELAIGTNTQAYVTVKKHNLFPILPILIAEKLGPHIAIGDPCFARGEDSPVYNLIGGREMIARENELTAMRKQRDCYKNFHTDITIPFEDMGLFAGVTQSGELIPIIKDGMFVPECAHSLNSALLKCQQ